MSNERFAGPGQIRERIRAFDWSKTPLGPIESWPKSLVGYVEMILAMPTPAIIFWGPEQTQIYNDGYAVIMGPRHPRYFGAPYRECWPDTFPTIYPFMMEVLQGGIAQFERTLFTLTRYGFTEEAYFTFTFSPLRDDSGAIVGIFQPVVEVTETVLHERRTNMLRVLSQRIESRETAVEGALETFASNAADVPFAVVYLWSDDERRLVRAGVCASLRERDLAPLDAVARAAFEAKAPRIIDDIEPLLGFAPPSPWGEPTRAACVVPLREASPTATRGVAVFGVNPRGHFDEAYQRFLESAAALFADAHERAVLVERERAARREAELQKERLTTLFTQAPMPILVLRGPEHVIELANAQACRVWGRTQEDVLGRAILSALPELAGQGFLELLDDVFRSGRRFLGKEILAYLRGPLDTEARDVYFNFVYEPLRSVEGAIEGVLVVAFDVTEEVRARHRMQQMRDVAERENRAKDEFLAMLGHELRNPLAPLVTAIQIVRQKLPSSPVDRHLAVMERQSDNLHRIVNDLLEVSRVTQGKIELRREPVDLVAIVERSLESTRELLDGRRHTVVVSMPRTPSRVYADPVRLEQVVVNLLTNAAKYTDAGGRIDVNVEAHGGAVELRIRDNGVGIADDLRPRLFELFQQGHRDSARAQGGIGVGLTIVRRLVELHGGRVEAHSEGAGKGSEFVVRLPALPSDVESVASRPPERLRNGARRRVLVVDDNQDAAATLAAALEALGHETHTVFDGPSAVHQCRAWKPDAMFVDIGLPGMDGYEVARELVRLAPRPLLVALTGYGQESDRARAHAAGFDEHLVKPAPMAAVADLLERLPGAE